MTVNRIQKPFLPSGESKKKSMFGSSMSVFDEHPDKNYMLRNVGYQQTAMKLSLETTQIIIY